MHALPRQRGIALILALMAPLAGDVVRPVAVLAQAPATRAAASPPTATPTDDDALACSYDWRGREEAIEAVLREAPVERFEKIPVGVTKPRRGYFAEGTPVRSIAWKVIPRDRPRGFAESHRAEVAAYRLSRLLGLDMVPPVVERRIDGQTGAAVMWIDDVRRWDVHDPPKRPGRHWSHQVSRMKLFDQLIANIDRNQGNLLHDEDGHLFLIDHSRAFTTRPTVAGIESPSQFDRALWERMDALTRAELDAALGDVLTSLEVKAILKRRDAMRKIVDARVRERGEAIAFLPALPADAPMRAGA